MNLSGFFRSRIKVADNSEIGTITIYLRNRGIETTKTKLKTIIMNLKEIKHERKIDAQVDGQYWLLTIEE